MRAEMIVEPEAAEVFVLVRSEGQQVGNVQVPQAAIQCPVLVFATTTDRVAR